MFAKLLKYDLKKHLSYFLIIGGIAIFSAVIAKLTASASSAFLIFVHEFSAGAMWAMVANALVNTAIRGHLYFRNSMYGDESYLTHTLPIKPHTIFWEKYVETFIILVLNFIIATVAIVITYGKDNLTIFFDSAFSILADGLGFSTGLLIFILVGILFFELFNIMIVVYFGNVFGRKKDDNKIRWSVIYGFLAYIVTQIVLIAIIVVAGIFNPEILKIFASEGTMITPEMIRPLFIITLAVYAAAPPILGLISAKSLDHGINIE